MSKPRCLKPTLGSSHLTPGRHAHNTDAANTRQFPCLTLLLLCPLPVGVCGGVGGGASRCWRLHPIAGIKAVNCRHPHRSCGEWEKRCAAADVMRWLPRACSKCVRVHLRRAHTLVCPFFFPSLPSSLPSLFPPQLSYYASPWVCVRLWVGPIDILRCDPLTPDNSNQQDEWEAREEERGTSGVGSKGRCEERERKRAGASVCKLGTQIVARLEQKFSRDEEKGRFCLSFTRRQTDGLDAFVQSNKCVKMLKNIYINTDDFLLFSVNISNFTGNVTQSHPSAGN